MGEACSFLYISGSPDEVLTFEVNEICKAEALHYCFECQQQILVGQRFEFHRGYYFETKKGVREKRYKLYRTCLHCVSIKKVFFCEDYRYGRVLYDLREHLEKINGNVSTKCMSGLTAKAKRRVVVMVQNVWDAIEKEERRELAATV